MWRSMPPGLQMSDRLLINIIMTLMPASGTRNLEKNRVDVSPVQVRFGV
jgi:hypothetical protein